jgi:hypothetical protein
MALDKDRIATNSLANADANIAALGDNPSLEDIRLAIEKGRIKALIDEITENMEITVTGVTVDPQTGEQYQEAQGTAL